MLRPQFVVLGVLPLQIARHHPVGVDPHLRALGAQLVVYEMAVCAVEAEVMPDSATEFFVAASRW